MPLAFCAATHVEIQWQSSYCQPCDLHLGVLRAGTYSHGASMAARQYTEVLATVGMCSPEVLGHSTMCCLQKQVVQ